MSNEKYYWIYILMVKNGNYYTGYTVNLVRRYLEHITGRGACKYTKSFRPVKLTQCWRVFEDKGIAMKIESYIKGKRRAQKDFLVSNPHKLKGMILKDLKINPDIYTFDPSIVEKSMPEIKGRAPGSGTDLFAHIPRGNYPSA